MALSLTCDCGARFEVEDTLAGQEVSCPECQQPLKAPALQALPVRTSALALASAVLALAGAFTVVGTLAAVGLGVAALVSIARHRDRLAGAGLAIFGIVAGCALTPLMVLALTTSELFDIGGWLNERTGQIDTSGPLEVVMVAKGFAITRPTEKWGQAPGLADPVLAPLIKDVDLLLIQPGRNAYVDVAVDRKHNALSLDAACDQVLADFANVPDNPFADGNDDEDLGPRRQPQFRRGIVPKVDGRRQLPAVGGLEGQEIDCTIRRAGQAWRFLVRVYKKRNGPTYVVRGYTPKRHFRRAEAELRQALDSFRVLSGK